MTPDTDRTREVWEYVGRFVMSQHIIDSAIEQYTDELPPALRKALLKSVLRTEERHRCLRAILEDRGLERGYPDLPDLFKSVAKRRNEIAHAYVTPDPHGGLTLTTWATASDGAEKWTPAQVEAFLSDGWRLRSLTMTLGIELGIIHTRVGERLLTGTEAIGEYGPDEPRPPFHSEDFKRRAGGARET